MCMHVFDERERKKKHNNDISSNPNLKVSKVQDGSF